MVDIPEALKGLTFGDRKLTHWREAGLKDPKAFYNSSKQLLLRSKQVQLEEWARATIPEKEYDAMNKAQRQKAVADIIYDHEDEYNAHWETYRAFLPVLFREIMEHDPEEFLRHSHSFAFMPWAKDLLVEAARREPRAAFKHSGQFLYVNGTAPDTRHTSEVMERTVCNLVHQHKAGEIAAIQGQRHKLLGDSPFANGILHARKLRALAAREEEASKRDVRPMAEEAIVTYRQENAKPIFREGMAEVLKAAAQASRDAAVASRGVWEELPFADGIHDILQEAHHQSVWGPRQQAEYQRQLDRAGGAHKK